MPQGPVFFGRDLPGIPPPLGTAGDPSSPGDCRPDEWPRCPPPTPRALALQCASREDWRCARSMHEFSAKDIDGRMVNLDKYRWVPAYLVVVGNRGKVSGPNLT